MKCAVLSLVLLLAFETSATTEIVSANGRFVAVITPRGGAELEARADLVVHALGKDGAREKRWSGVLPDHASRGARREFVTDDGAAFVRIDDRAEAGILVRAVLKGVPAAALDLDDLSSVAASDGRWIDLEHGLRWRPNPGGLNAQWVLDLLGLDGVVRTLDLDGGALEVKRDHTRALDLLVHPPVPEPVRPATRETFVDSWEAPSLAWSAATIEIHGRGHDPSAGWRFIGFLVQGNPFETGRLVLVPHSVPPQGSAAQVLRPHLWTARVNGLPPGRFQLDVCGRETPPADPRRDPTRLDPEARTIELLSPHLIVELELPAAPNGAREAIALHDDGRIELDYAGTRVFRLAPLEVEAGLRARVAALGDGRPRPPPRAEVDRAGALTWRVPVAPARVLLGAQLAPAERALVDELRRVRDALDPERAPRAFAISRAESSFALRSAVEGAADVPGLAFVAERFDGRCLVDPIDVTRSRFSYSIDAGSLQPRAKDELATPFLERALETASHPRIEFASTSLELVSAETRGRALADVAARPVEAVVTGELVLHGVKRTVRAPLTIEFRPERVRLRGRFVARHTEHAMERLVATRGAVKLADEIEMVFDAVFVR